jgi:hypothetical protein
VLNELSTGKTSPFLPLLNVHMVSDVRQMEEHTAQTLVLGPHHFQVEIAVPKMKNYKLPGSDRILAESGVETLGSGVHTLMNAI